MALSPEERRRRIQQCAAGPKLLREAVAEVPAEAMQWRPVEGEFSVHQIVVHSADAETIDAARIRYLVAEENATIVGYDESGWARSLDYHSHPVELALATVEAVRANTLPLIERLPEASWSAVGHHTQSGPCSADDWLRIYSEHLEDHIDQIRRTVEAWRSR